MFTAFIDLRPKGVAIQKKEQLTIKDELNASNNNDNDARVDMIE